MEERLGNNGLGDGVSTSSFTLQALTVTQCTNDRENAHYAYTSYNDSLLSQKG
jgi:hypothetical protein